MSEAPNPPHPTKAQRVAFVTAFRDVFLHDIHTVVDIVVGSTTRDDAVRAIAERYGLDDHTANGIVDGQLFHLTVEGQAAVEKTIRDTGHGM